MIIHSMTDMSYYAATDFSFSKTFPKLGVEGRLIGSASNFRPIPGTGNYLGGEGTWTVGDREGRLYGKFSPKGDYENKYEHYLIMHKFNHQIKECGSYNVGVFNHPFEAADEMFQFVTSPKLVLQFWTHKK